MFCSYILAATLLVSASAAPLDGLSISDITRWGTGCPQDTTDFWVKTNGNCIQANFGSFDVRTSPQDQTTEYCGLGVTVAVPAGKQYSVASTSYRDDIDVGAGVTGSHIMSYTFQGSQGLAETRHDFVGPVKGTFDITDAVPAGNRVWSACGSLLQLMIANRGSVVGKGSAGTSYFNDGVVSTNIEWRNC